MIKKDSEDAFSFTGIMIFLTNLFAFIIIILSFIICFSARPDYIIPFQIAAGTLSGKRGLLKIISVSGSENGSVEFAMIIQK